MRLNGPPMAALPADGPSFTAIEAAFISAEIELELKHVKKIEAPSLQTNWKSNKQHLQEVPITDMPK